MSRTIQQQAAGSAVMEQTIRTGQGAPLSAYVNPWTMAQNLWSHRNLIWQLARRDLVGRYRAAKLGLLWSVLTPLVLLCIYTFVFSFVFGSRWGVDPNESRGEFALTLFCGMLLFNLFSEVVNRAPFMVLANPNYVKKVVFPLEVFAVSGLISGLINMLIGYGVWMIGWLAIRQTYPHLTLLWFPVVLLPVCLTTAGIAWFLASVGVFVRDVGHAVALLVQMLFFTTPVFYRIEQVHSERIRSLLRLNPLAHALEDARQVLMWGQSPNWYWWICSVCASGMLAILGYAFFMKSKRAFADVI